MVNDYSDPNTDNPAPPQRQDLYGGIQNAYKTYLGRDANPDELAFHARTSPDNYDAVIKGSSEAQQWAARGAGQPAASGQPAATPGNGYDYNKAQDSWFHAAPGTSIDAWIAANPSFTQGITSGKNGEFMNLPGGESFDAVRDKGVGGANAPVWGSYDYNYSTGQKYTPAEAAAAEEAYMRAHGGGGGGGGSSSSSAYGSSTPGAVPSNLGPNNDPMRAQFISALMSRANQSLAVDPSDPAVRGQADAFSANTERSRRNYLAQQAETQGPNANLTGEARLTAEQAGQANGGFEAGLIGQQITARRKEIQDALTQMQGQLSADQIAALQKELGYLDDATRKYGIQTQANTAQSGINSQWQQALLRNNVDTGDLALRAEDQYNRNNALNSGIL